MMKKILIVSIAVVVAIALILFVPVPIGPAKDGGTRQYAALTYRIVVWNRFVDQTDADGQLMTTVYHNTSVYWYPDNRKTVDELWEMEMERTEEYVSAVISPQEPITIAQLRETYPEYFELSVFKGLEVYVWEMAKGQYRCGVLSGTNRLKTEEEILNLAPATIEEMRLILSTYDIPQENISVRGVRHPLSSYYYEIDAPYQEKVRTVFWGE